MGIQKGDGRMLLLENGRVLTRDAAQPWLEDGAVLVEKESIVAVGPRQQLAAAYPQARSVDAGGGLIMPALLNTHNHIYSALARGLSVRGYAPRGFGDILEGLWWKLDSHLNNADNRVSAALTAVDCIKNGVTTIFDHHASYGQTGDSLFVIGEQLRRAGLRCSLCYEVSDRNGKQQAEEAIRENASFIAAARQSGDPLLRGMMGLHASFTLSDATLEQAVAAAGDAGCHIHLAEGIADQQDSLAKYGKRVTARLAERGVLGPKTIAVHGVHTDAAEIALLAETDTMLVHNPESNMGNAVGCPPVMTMLAQGILCGLGTDGYTNDMLESYKVANILHKHALADCNAAWAEAPRMLFENNPAIAARFFDQPLGVLRPGAAADIIVCDYQPITPMGETNANGHILFGINGRGVVTTIAAGQVLMENRRLTTLDEAEIAAQARVQAAKLWQRING